MAPVKWNVLESSVAMKRKINMDRGSPDYRIEAVLASTVQKRKSPSAAKKLRTSLRDTTEKASLLVTYVDLSSEARNYRNRVDAKYCWKNRDGDWSMKGEKDSEDLLNLNAFFEEVRSHSAEEVR